MSLQKRHSTRNRIKDIAKRGNVYSPSTEKAYSSSHMGAIGVLELFLSWGRDTAR